MAEDDQVDPPQLDANADSDIQNALANGDAVKYYRLIEEHGRLPEDQHLYDKGWDIISRGDAPWELWNNHEDSPQSQTSKSKICSA